MGSYHKEVERLFDGFSARKRMERMAQEVNDEEAQAPTGHTHDGTKTNCPVCGGWQVYAPKLSTKEEFELFGGADFDESEDGPYRPRKHREGQWSRLQEDEGMTGID